MKLASIIFVTAAVVVATVMARPDGDQAEEQFRALLEANDAVSYDRDYPESFATRNTRQNTGWISWGRGPTVLIGKNFPNMESCLERCRQMDYPAVIFRNGICTCRAPLMRVGELE